MTAHVDAHGALLQPQLCCKAQEVPERLRRRICADVSPLRICSSKAQQPRTEATRRIPDDRRPDSTEEPPVDLIRCRGLEPADRAPLHDEAITHVLDVDVERLATCHRCAIMQLICVWA